MSTLKNKRILRRRLKEKWLIPRFDILCRTCGGDSEIIAPDISAIECRCGSKDVERRWTAPPMFKMMGERNGETIGERKFMADVTRKAYEKQAVEAGVSHGNTRQLY